MIKIGQLECTNIKWGSSCPKLWQTFEGLTKISLMKHHPCNKTSWDVCVCVCVWPILCLVFKRFRAHMNWIQWSQQMNVDKILCLRKKHCWTTSLLLGKKNYNYNRVIRKVRKHKVLVLGLRKRDNKHKKARCAFFKSKKDRNKPKIAPWFKIKSASSYIVCIF
jgi:hypothetical protein